MSVPLLQYQFAYVLFVTEMSPAAHLSEEALLDNLSLKITVNVLLRAISSAVKQHGAHLGPPSICAALLILFSKHDSALDLFLHSLNLHSSLD